MKQKTLGRRCTHIEYFDSHITAGIGLTGQTDIVIGFDGIQPYYLHSASLCQIRKPFHNSDSAFSTLSPSPARRHNGDSIALKGDKYGCYQVCFHALACIEHMNGWHAKIATSSPFGLCTNAVFEVIGASLYIVLQGFVLLTPPVQIVE